MAAESPASVGTPPLRVLFDQQIMAQRYGGVSRYVLSLLRALNERGDVQAQLAALAHCNSYIRPGDALHPFSFALDHPRRGTRFRARLMEPLLRLGCAVTGPQLIHETGFMRHAQGRSSRMAVVTTLHDMILERMPNLFEKPDLQIRERRLALQRADAIVCISACTQADLMRHYPEFAAKSHVVWHGVDQAVSSDPSPATNRRPYLLYVGLRGGYKNFDTLLQAFGSSGELRRSHDLVCLGGGALQPAEVQTATRLGVNVAAGQLRVMNGDDAVLAAAYRHAAAFVFPSRFEGFGMPLTEAMVQGCPIVCSRASAFPEVAGDAAAYFDPDNADDMRRVIEQAVLDEAHRAELSRLSRARAGTFLWSRCAARTLDVYRLAMQAHRH